MQFDITYKWTIYQPPATKSFEHFKKSLWEKMDALNDGKLDLNVSPVIVHGGKQYMLLFLDIEQLVNPSIFNIRNLYYAYSGRGIHVYLPYYTDYQDILQHRTEIIQMFKNTVVDIITTLKITPFRFMGAYSDKHNVWLHPMTTENVDYAVSVAKVKPFDLMSKEQYYNKILGFFSKLKYMKIKDFMKLYAKIREVLA